MWLTIGSPNIYIFPPYCRFEMICFWICPERGSAAPPLCGASVEVCHEQTNLWSSTAAPLRVLLLVTVHSSVEHGIHDEKNSWDRNHLLTFIPRSERTKWSPDRSPRKLFLFLEQLSSFCWVQGWLRAKVNSRDAFVHISFYIYTCLHDEVQF